MHLNVDPGFDADLEIAHRALERGWVTPEGIESAILAHEKTPGSRLLNHLPLTPEQRHRLLTPESASIPPEIAQVAHDPARQFDHYILGDFLHSGGMGRVHKAWDLKLSRWVALKCLKAVGDERSEAYFEREARLAAGLSHPNIAAIYESGQSAGERYIAMQFIPGQTLDKRRRGEVTRLVALVRDAARAVAHANSRGIVHRDLKPSNLMVTPEGQIYVLDFGLARPVDLKARHSATGKAMGTPAYMSPEQARGGSVDARSDVYGMGATLYECLAGRPPFSGATIYDVLRHVEETAPAPPRRLNPRIPPDLQTIVLKCLEKDPARRYGTADELADDLDRFLKHDPIAARPAGIVYRIGRRLAKRKALAIASLASIVLAGVLGWWVFVGRPQSEALRVRNEHLNLRESAMKLWAEARGTEMAGTHPKVLSRKARAAREAFERALAIREDPQAHLMRGRCLQLEGRDGEAIQALERAHDMDPGNPEARVELAKALLIEYRTSRGFPRDPLVLHPKSLEASIDVRGLSVETTEQRRLRERGEKLLAAAGAGPAHTGLLNGLLALGKGQFKAAAEALSAYTRAEPWDAQAWWLEGNCLYYMGEFKAAIAAFDRSLGRVSSAAAFWSRGSAKNAIGLNDEAISDFTRALESEPNFAGAYNSRGLAHSSSGRLDEAIADYTKTIELAPDSAVAYNNRGNARASKGMIEEAVGDYTKAIELNPVYAVAYANRANLKADQGRTGEALADFAKAIELEPGNAGTWYNRALTFGRRGELDAAISDYTRAIELDPKEWRAFSFRGLNRLKKGLNEDAIADFTRALEINPNLPEVLTNRARARYLTGSVADAIADWKKALEVAPPDWPGREEVRDVLANHEVRRLFKDAHDLHVSKRYQGAIDAFRKIIEDHPKTRQAVMSAYNVACGYALLGEKDKALEWLEKAVDMGWKDAAHLEKDSDLDSLREEAGFKKLLGRLKGE